MAKRIQLRRGTTSQHNNFTGALGEVTVDTEKDVLVVHDGETAGGFPVAARANSDGSVSVISKNGTMLGTIPSTGLFINNLTTTTTNQALTAAQGKKLQDTKLDKTANAVSATKLETPRTISITGGAAGTATSFDGTENINIPVTSLDASKLSGTAPVNTTGSARHLANLGQLTALSGTTLPPLKGLSFGEVYQNGYPTNYGNVLRFGGTGQGEMLVGWSGTNGAAAPVYFRNKRDSDSASWSEWREVVFKDDITNVVGDPLVYMPIPYPKATPPAGYLAMQGQWIDSGTYPKLYAMYGQYLPDLRGLVIRGLDGGRGMDSEPSRGVLSYQADATRNFNGGWKSYSWDGSAWGIVVNDSVATGGAGTGANTNRTFNFDLSRQVPVANEIRVKNMAFLYIVKAG